MRTGIFERFSCLPFLVPLLAILTSIPQVGFAQHGSHHSGSGTRMSVGSTWSRHGNSPPSVGYGHRGAHSGFSAPIGRSPRFFGGVTVGQGFYPYYLPGYFNGYSPYYPGYGGPLGYSFGTPGVHVSVGSAYFGPLYHGALPFTLPYFYGGNIFPNGSATYFRAPNAMVAPSIGFGAAARNPVSHARINNTPPVDFGRAFGRPIAPLRNNEVFDFALSKSKIQAAIDKAPLAGEFVAAATNHRDVTSLDKIESLRLQTQGDRALRESDPELARTLYQAAIRATPDRQSSWIRMAWVHVFQRDYSKAAMAMNRAVLSHSGTETGWIRAEELLGSNPVDRSVLSDVGLWSWLQDRPGSADRLLLVAGYQYFLGRGQTASEMLELARSAGLRQSSYDLVSQVVNARRDEFPLPGSPPVSEAISSNTVPSNEPKDLIEAIAPPQGVEPPLLKLPSLSSQ